MFESIFTPKKTVKNLNEIFDELRSNAEEFRLLEQHFEEYVSVRAFCHELLHDGGYQRWPWRLYVEALDAQDPFYAGQCILVGAHVELLLAHQIDPLPESLLYRILREWQGPDVDLHLESLLIVRVRDILPCVFSSREGRTAHGLIDVQR